ncbi:MAG: DeoR/GlpR family DNA-binding transcription regulator [Acidimicrobiales bacterium]
MIKGDETEREQEGVPAEVRQGWMAAVVRDAGFARVSDLASRFSVSTVTVRSDLQALEGGGQLRRVRGGAVTIPRAHTELPFEATVLDLAPEKARIGAAAAAMVHDGDAVVLDVGTTTTAVARALVARPDLRDVTVFTSGLNIAIELERAYPAITVVVTGGTVRPLQHSLVNPLGTLLLERLSASIAFVGCNGVDPDGGVTNVNLPEAEIKRAMLHAARQRVVVADGSKLGQVELAKICDLGELDVIVTDASADSGAVERIEAAGCHVVIAGTRRSGKRPRSDRAPFAVRRTLGHH